MPVGKSGCEWRLANCDVRHAFSGNSKQLQRHDSVHLSSVYTDCNFSSTHCMWLLHVTATSKSPLLLLLLLYIYGFLSLSFYNFYGARHNASLNTSMYSTKYDPDDKKWIQFFSPVSVFGGLGRLRMIRRASRDMLLMVSLRRTAVCIRRTLPLFLHKNSTKKARSVDLTKNSWCDKSARRAASRRTCCKQIICVINLRPN